MPLQTLGLSERPDGVCDVESPTLPYAQQYFANAAYMTTGPYAAQSFTATTSPPDGWSHVAATPRQTPFAPLVEPGTRALCIVGAIVGTETA